MGVAVDCGVAVGTVFADDDVVNRTGSDREYSCTGHVEVARAIADER